MSKSSAVQEISVMLLPAIATLQQGPQAVSDILNAVHALAAAPPLVRKAISAGLNAVGNSLPLIKRLYKASITIDQICPLVADRSFAGLPSVPSTYCLFARAGKQILRERALALGATEQDILAIDQSVASLPGALQRLLIASQPTPESRTTPWIIVGAAAMLLLSIIAIIVFIVNRSRRTRVKTQLKQVETALASKKT